MKNNRSPASPRLAYIGRLYEDPHWYFPSHNHEDVSEIIYIAAGEGSFTINGISYAAGQGDLLVYNKGIIHEEHSSRDNPLKTYYCGITNIKLAGLDENSLLSETATPHIPKNRYSAPVEGLFALMYEEAANKPPNHEAVCRHLLQILLILLQRMVRVNPPGPPKDPAMLASRIKNFLDKHYRSPLKLQTIAAALALDPYYISHVFKKHYSDSLMNYVLYRRLGEAKRLLLNTPMKIWEIAHYVGYENASYFTTLFTKKMGETPTEYKKTGRKERVNLRRE